MLYTILRAILLSNNTHTSHIGQRLQYEHSDILHDIEVRHNIAMVLSADAANPAELKMPSESKFRRPKF